MHFSVPVLSLLALASSTTALQNIFIGNIGSGCGSGSIKGGKYWLWFTDSPSCAEGTDGGYTIFGNNLCGKQHTILGHEGITFRGCNTKYGTLPTTVYDGKNKALDCRPVTASDAVTEQCPSTCGGASTHTLRYQMRCA